MVQIYLSMCSDICAYVAGASPFNLTLDTEILVFLKWRIQSTGFQLSATLSP